MSSVEDDLRGERDRARDVAVQLEQLIAAAVAVHDKHANPLRRLVGGAGSALCRCVGCDMARALGVTE